MDQFFVWDPNKTALVIPVINYPIAWYGVLFAFGFFIGLMLFVYLLYRFLLLRPFFLEKDLKWKEVKASNEFFQGTKQETIQYLNDLISKKIEEVVYLNSRAFLFLKKRVDEKRVMLAYRRLMLEKDYPTLFLTLKEKARLFGDSLVLYAVVGTVIGSRLGHILFYEQIGEYLQDPFRIFMIWEGGLASHGGIAGVLVSLILFYRKHKEDIPSFHWISLLDLMVIPSCFIATCIRLGNFINQEILGIPTHMPWSVVFLHPIDGSAPIPRHPVQLYEAFFYLFMLFYLHVLFRKKFAHLSIGLLSGNFFFFTFVFRFFIEFFKEREDVLLQSFPLLMGQVLSLPFILFGLYLYIKGQKLTLMEKK
ncbi:MAG: prolipoprotein diacylglyceryl transferase [Chlamydiales bacterium]|nr:prolipoprotein diacylglyceryl transferase [Chlamydiales bacterium]